MHRTVLTLALALCMAIPALAETYRLKNGQLLTGEPISFTDRGMVLKIAEGSYTPATPWTDFSQESLRELRNNPKAAPFVAPLIRLTEEEKRELSGLELADVPRVERPTGSASFFALFSTSTGFFLLFVIYLGNVFAGYEVAMYRGFSTKVVCGVSAVVPLLGPIAMLALPRKLLVNTFAPDDASDELEEVDLPEGSSLTEGLNPAAEPHAPSIADVPASPESTQVEEAAPEEPGFPLLPDPVTYSRGIVTFNRRFFETKLSKYLKTVPPEDIKDMVLDFRTSRGNHTGTKINKVDQEALFLHVPKGNASDEVRIPFLEIYEVVIRHKDAA